MSLFSELKNRNVFRVAAAYVVVAWLVIQVVETIFPAFGFGESAVRVVVIVFAIGLVPTLVLSWIFEFTPEGIRRENEVDRTRLITARSGRNFDRAIMIVLALAVGWFAFDKFILNPARLTEIEKTTAERVRSQTLVESYGDSSIAVLPFVNMSDDASNEYFSDGMSEELLNLLAKIPQLRVISQSSSFAFKGKEMPIPEVAARLNVAFVLEGSVRKFTNRVRITAQLIEARSDTHLWSETYDRTLDDLFAIQDEISAAIVAELKARLKLDVGAAPKANSETSIEAHDAVLRGRYLVAQRTPESMKAAVAEFEKAVSIDPDYALAHAELALALFLTPPGDLTQEEYSAKKEAHLKKALALDPTLAEAHAAKAFFALETSDPEEQLAEFRRAIEFNPNYAIVYFWMASWGLASSHEEAFAYLETAIRLDPLSTPINIGYIKALIARNRLADADRQLDKYALTDPRGAAIWRGVRSSIGGNWANYVLAYLEAATAGPEEIAYGSVGLEKMIFHLDFIGLKNEARRLARDNDVAVYIGTDSPETQVRQAQERLGKYPADYEAQIAVSLALANAGRYAEARPYLEHHWQYIAGSQVSWDWSETKAEIAVALIAVLRDAGDEAAANQVLVQFRQDLNRFREAGIVLTQSDKSVDYREGQAAYLAGEREAGLALMSKAVEDGYWVKPPKSYQLAMYQDPGFIEIIKKQKSHQAREREKVLGVVCNNNSYSAVWQPARATCARFHSKPD